MLPGDLPFKVVRTMDEIRYRKGWRIIARNDGSMA
jgi:hypothetical protein